MKRKKKLLSNQVIIAIIISLVIISAVGIAISMYRSSSEPLSGKAYSDLSSGQKQLYWKCMTDNKCNVLLKEAQVSKDYTAYRKCAKDCSDSASNLKPESYYCNDSDGTDFLTKSAVVSNLYPQGKEDYCFTFPNGKTYLMEGICKDNKYAYVQKGCGEMGAEYGCEGGKCIEELPTFNSILEEEIPQDWINQFNNDFQIEFKAYVPTIKYPNGSLEYVEENKTMFSEEEKNTLTEALYKAVYTMSKVDSYFTKPLPWTNGQSYYNWLKSSSGTIVFYADPNSLNCAPPGKIRLNGYNIINNVNDGILTTWYNLSSGMGIMSLISIITHETRHHDGIGHVSCKNRKNMDKNLKSMGAHGVNVMLRHWIKYLLPPELVQSAYDEKVNWMFSHYSYLDRMCSLDPVAKTLEQGDLDWVKNISGYPLDFDSEIMWTVNFNSESETVPIPIDS